MKNSGNEEAFTNFPCYDLASVLLPKLIDAEHLCQAWKYRRVDDMFRIYITLEWNTVCSPPPQL